MAKIVITVDNRKPSDEVLKQIKDAGIEAVFKPCSTAEAVVEAGQDADAMMVGHSPETTRSVFEQCLKLKAVSRNGVGVDSVDLEAATQMGVCVCNTPAINGPEVADHAIALILGLTRKIPELLKITETRDWSKDPGRKGRYWSEMRRIAGMTVGIYGFGNIGRTFAMSMRGFGPRRILAHDAYVRQDTAAPYGVEMVDFQTLLKECDIISLHAPAVPDNYRIFNAEAFKAMKPEALLINCARGALVDEQALVAALEKGLIAGAGVDVTEVEPPAVDHPFYQAPNMIMTPHMAGGSDLTHAEGSRQWAANMICILTGKKPYGLVNPQVAGVVAELRKRGDARWDGFPDPVI